MTPRQVALPLAALVLAWATWHGAAWLFATLGLVHGTLLLQAVLVVLALGLADWLLGRLAGPGDAGH